MNKLAILCVCLLVLFLSCNDRSTSKVHTYPSPQQSMKGIEGNYKYYFEHTLSEIKKLPWRKIIVDSVNDEYNEWIEAKFYFTDSEWILIETGNMDDDFPLSLEITNNYFLKDYSIQVGDKISHLMLIDSAHISFDDENPSLIVGYNQVKATCLDSVSNLELDEIIDAKKAKRVELFPEKFKDCRVSSVRILNIK